MLKQGRRTVTEEELIRGCAGGSEQHFYLLYHKHYGKMLNVCRRYARDNDEAQGMVQEGFIRVFKSINQFAGQGSFEGWLRKVMVTSSINYFHKHYSNNLLEYVDGQQLARTTDGEDIYHSFSSDTTSPRYDAEELLRLVQQLPAVSRMVFNLNVMEGYAHAEIAGMLKMTESSSRACLSRAKQKLREMIQSDTFQKV